MSAMLFTHELGTKHSNLRCFGLNVELEEEAVAKYPSQTNLLLQYT